MAGAKDSGAAIRALGVVVLLIAAAVWWNWKSDHAARQRFDDQTTPIASTPAPIISSDTVNPPPARHIYPDISVAQGDVAVALAEAKKNGKRVLLDFGGDWCPDCQVLDIYFHQTENAQLLADNFILVDVNIGRMDQNVDLAAKYGVPIAKGVPALAVVDGDGKVVYAQKTGEFNSMARMQSSSVTDFLNQWKPQQN